MAVVADSLQRANRRRCDDVIESKEVAVATIETGFSAAHQTRNAVDGVNVTALVTAVIHPFKRIAWSVT